VGVLFKKNRIEHVRPLIDNQLCFQQPTTTSLQTSVVRVYRGAAWVYMGSGIKEHTDLV
jgi:hypothetical protein